MSASAPTEQRRPSPAVVSGVVLACFALVAGGLLWARLGRVQHPGPERLSRPSAPGVPRIEQAPWRVDKFPAGVLGKLTRRETKRLQRRGPRVGELVRDVYDAVFLQPAHLPAVARSDFSRAAARSWQRSRAGLPAHAERVKLLSRRARIGIDAESARRAVASVVVRAAGWRGARRFRLLHRATLWIERGARGWRIVAYDLAQGPAHT